MYLFGVNERRGHVASGLKILGHQQLLACHSIYLRNNIVRKQVLDRLAAMRQATEDESGEYPQRRRSDELLSQSPNSIEKDAQRHIISPIDYAYYWANHFSDKAAALYTKGFLDLPEGTSLDDIPQEYKGRRDMVNSMMATLEQEFVDKLKTALELTGSGLH